MTTYSRCGVTLTESRDRNSILRRVRCFVSHQLAQYRMPYRIARSSFGEDGDQIVLQLVQFSLQPMHDCCSKVSRGTARLTVDRYTPEQVRHYVQYLPREILLQLAHDKPLDLQMAKFLNQLMKDARPQPDNLDGYVFFPKGKKNVLMVFFV